MIKTVIIFFLDKIAPEKIRSVRARFFVPWFDRELVKLSQKRTKLYNKARRLKTDASWDEFKAIRNQFKKLFMQKKATYYHNFIANNPQTSNKLWSKVQPLLNPNKNRTNIHVIKQNGISHNSNEEITKMFLIKAKTN
jgi:hypothetical protein